jgi:hypothetical protein
MAAIWDLGANVMCEKHLGTDPDGHINFQFQNKYKSVSMIRKPNIVLFYHAKPSE